MLFILNESKAIDWLGDLNIYASAELLLGNIEAIDVRNNEYFAFTENGQRVFLLASSDWSSIKYRVEDEANCERNLASLLTSYLNARAGDTRFKINPFAVALASNSLKKLIKMVPQILIVRE